MSESVKAVALIDIAFIVMLLLSGSLTGFLGEAVYYLAFIIPIAIGFKWSARLKYDREERRGLAEPGDGLLTFDKKRLLKLLPLIAPSVTAVFLVSLLFSYIYSLVGVTAPPVEDTGIVNMLLVHAFVPAILEESLFRYIPMKLILPYSKKWCVLYSSLFFALIHCSLVQLPYAFVAGIIFMLIDVALGSVWPSVILHFVNNTASIVCMKYCSDTPRVLIFVSVLTLLSLLSLFFLWKKRGEYKRVFRGALDSGESGSVGSAPIMLAMLCLFLAVTSI